MGTVEVVAPEKNAGLASGLDPRLPGRTRLRPWLRLDKHLDFGFSVSWEIMFEDQERDQLDGKADANDPGHSFS